MSGYNDKKPSRLPTSHSSSQPSEDHNKETRPSSSTGAINENEAEARRSDDMEEVLRAIAPENRLRRGSPEQTETMPIRKPSAEIPSLKVEVKSRVATTSGETSSRNVRFMLPDHNLDRTVSSMLNDEKSVGPTNAPRIEEGEPTKGKGKDREYRMESKDPSVTSKDHSNYKGITDNTHQAKIGHDPERRDKTNQQKQPQVMPLLLRLAEDSPYPPPAFPPPVPPRRRPDAQGRSQVAPFTRASQPHQGYQKTGINLPSRKATIALRKELENFPSIINQAEGAEVGLSTAKTPTNTEKAKTEILPVFPSFGSSPIESSSSQYSSVDLQEFKQPIKTSVAGPKVPTVVTSHVTETEKQASTTERSISSELSEMPTSSGSPIFHGASTRAHAYTGRNAGLSHTTTTTTQGISDTTANSEGTTEGSRGTAGGNYMTAPFRLPRIPRLTPMIPMETPQEVVDATAELQKLASGLSPLTHAHPEGVEQAYRNLHGGRSPTESEDTVIRRPRARATNRGTDRIHPTAVVAASTPNRVLTHDFIHGVIQAEMHQFQQDLNANRISRSGAITSLSRVIGRSSIRTEAGLRTFVRHQAAIHAPEISAY
ncbi:hypothetical protein F4804DRAFT_94881 [Jackrogersella minutella]|nr:hypothetical protein F4804DRAFT_94881 [Jackrogersella minutella]